MFLYFRAVYSAIYEFSHSENGLVTYSLDQGGNRKYEEFIDGISASLNSQWARNICPEDVSKDDRHVLRLAAVLHVLYDQLTKFLQEEEKSPPPQVISSLTIQRSITLCQYFTAQRRILDQVSGCSIIKQLVNKCDYFLEKQINRGHSHGTINMKFEKYKPRKPGSVLLFCFYFLFIPSSRATFSTLLFDVHFY